MHSIFEFEEENTGRISRPQRFFRPAVASSASSAVGLTTVLYTTGVLAASACLPVLAGMMVGLAPAIMINSHLNYEYSSRRIFASKPKAEMIFNFVLRASTYTLGLLISLAIASMMVTIAFNPFTTSALIAGGVSAALILSMYLFLGYKANQSMKDIPSIMSSYSGAGAYGSRRTAERYQPVAAAATSNFPGHVPHTSDQYDDSYTDERKGVVPGGSRW